MLIVTSFSAKSEHVNTTSVSVFEVISSSSIDESNFILVVMPEEGVVTPT